MVSEVIGWLLEVVAETLLSFPPKSKRGIAILCTVFGLLLAAIVYFGWFHGGT